MILKKCLQPFTPIPLSVHGILGLQETIPTTKQTPRIINLTYPWVLGLGLLALVLFFVVPRSITEQEKNIGLCVIVLMVAVLSRVSMLSLSAVTGLSSDFPNYHYPAYGLFSCLCCISIAWLFSRGELVLKLRQNDS